MDLEEARNRESSTDPVDRNRCPECKTVNLKRRNTGIVHDGYEFDYRCRRCGNEFDRPVTDVPESEHPR